MVRLTEEEFRAVFEIYVNRRGISRDLRGILRRILLRRHWEEMKNLDPVIGLFSYLDKVLPDLIVSEIGSSGEMGLSTSDFWGILYLRIPLNKFSGELIARLDSVIPQFVSLLLQFFREQGIDLAELHGVEDPQAAQRFKTILEEGGWEEKEEG